MSNQITINNNKDILKKNIDSNIVKENIKKDDDSDIDDNKDNSDDPDINILIKDTQKINITPKYVLEICSIPKCIDINMLKNLITNYLEPRLSFYKENKSNLFIEDEFSEFFIKKATKGTHIGNGNCPMDIKTQDNDGIDVTCLCINGKQTNEKSIIQNFAESGNQLDKLFVEKKDKDAIDMYSNDLKKKWNDVKIDKNLNNLYYICFTSDKNNVYLTAFKINPEYINLLTSGGFSTGGKSIIIKNFIDLKIGKVTLYKSKKRIELRLLSEIISNSNTVKLFSNNIV
jgi:hypothetical protein